MNMNTQGFKYQAFHEYLNTNLFAAARSETLRSPSSWNDHKKWNFGEGIIDKIHTQLAEVTSLGGGRPAHVTNGRPLRY